MAVASEQFPKGGAVAINMLGGAGMLAAGIVGSVLLGAAQDHSTRHGLEAYDTQNHTSLVATYLTETKVSIFGAYKALDDSKLATAPAEDKAVLAGLGDAAKKDALKEVALLPVITLLIYIGLIAWFRRRGGYRPVVLGAASETIDG